MRVRLDDVKTGRVASSLASAPRLKDVVPGWLAGRSPDRRSDDRGRLETHVLPYFGEWRLDTITEMAIDAFIRDLEEKPARRHGQKSTDAKLAPNTIKNVLIVLRKLLGDHGYRVSVSYKVGERAAPWLDSPADVEAFLDECRPRWFRMAAYLACYAGLRKGEIAGLLWDRIDWQRRFMLIDRSYTKPTKGKKLRPVPLPDELAEELKLWRKHRTHGTPLVVTVGGESITEETDVARPTRRACRRAGVREVNFHQLRHTAASHWAQKLSLAKVGVLLGHEDPRTTQRYAHVDPKALVQDPDAHLSYRSDDDETSTPPDPSEET